MLERDSQPLEAAVLDGLGGHAVLTEKWTMVRNLVDRHAKERSPESKKELERMLVALAINLEEDVKHILPKRQNQDLWQSRSHAGVLTNPIFSSTLVRARDGHTQEAIDRVGIEVLDDELVRFLRTADRVLKRLGESPEPVVVAEKHRQRADPPGAGRAIKRGRPVWLKDGSDLAPAVRKLLPVLPAPTWSAAAKKAGISEGTASTLSQPLQDARLVERRDDQWHPTPFAHEELGRGTGKKDSEAREA